MVKRLNCYKGRRAAMRGLTLVELLAVLIVITFLVCLVMDGVASPRAKEKAQMAACESNLKQIGIAYRIWEGDYGNKYPQELIASGNTNFPLGSDPTGYILNHPLPIDAAARTSLPYGYAYQCYQVMSNELNNPKVVLCPSDERPVGSIPTDFINLPPSNTVAFNNDTVSYFVGADADEARPAMLLSGDRNLLKNAKNVSTGLAIFGTNDAIGWSGQMHKFTGNFGLADGSVQRGDAKTLQLYLNRTGTNVNRLLMP